MERLPSNQSHPLPTRNGRSFEKSYPQNTESFNSNQNRNYTATIGRNTSVNTIIERLESELSQKITELHESLTAQHVLHERLRCNMKTMIELEKLLTIVEANLRHSNEYIVTLKQDNQKLKSSCDEWTRRALKLEFEILSARDTAKK